MKEVKALYSDFKSFFDITLKLNLNALKAHYHNAVKMCPVLEEFSDNSEQFFSVTATCRTLYQRKINRTIGLTIQNGSLQTKAHKKHIY